MCERNSLQSIIWGFISIDSVFYLTTEFKSQLEAIVDTLENRVLTNFENIESEADKATDEAWNESMSQPASEYEYQDPGDLAGSALYQEVGISLYQLLAGVRQGIINLFAVALYHCFEQQIVLFREQELRFPVEQDKPGLAQDPTMRIIVGRRDTDRSAASTNTMSRFETEVLTQDGNVEGLGRLNAKWVDGAMSRTPHRRVILDMDSSESPVHGEQEGASYNGHFGSTCYHPLFVFNQFGDCEGAKLRAGNVHSAHRWHDVLDPILSRYGGVRRYFRADAAFAKPDIYEYLEERRVFYAIRLPSNKVLQYEIAPLLIRPVGRPPKRPVILYDDFWYRAGSWDRARRVVAKVEWHRGELFPRVGFIVTNMTAGPEGVVRFYNGRGTAEQWIKEGKYALNWTRLSCHRFVANRVRLSLFILAYNLGNFLRRLCLPKAVRHWSLRSVQVKLIKMGGRLVRHSRRLIFQLSEVSVPRRLFQGVLDRIGRLSPVPS